MSLFGREWLRLGRHVTLDDVAMQVPRDHRVMLGALLSPAVASDQSAPATVENLKIAPLTLRRSRVSYSWAQVDLFQSNDSRSGSTQVLSNSGGSGP